jgi:hypothetical protein
MKMPTTPITSTNFQTAWPAAYQPNFQNHISQVAWNIFSVVVFPIGLLRLAQHCIVAFDRSENTVGQKLHFRAPDGVNLSGTLFAERASSTKVILAIEGTSAGLSSQTLEMLQQTGATIMTLDCRGKSSGFYERTKIHWDVYSAYEYLIRERNIHPNDILLYAHSDSGAFGLKAAQWIQEKYPQAEIKCMINSAYSDLANEFSWLLGGGILGKMAGQFIKAIGWQVNNKEAFDQLKGKKCLIYDKNDRVIPFKASLLQAVKSSLRGQVTKIKCSDTRGFSRPAAHGGPFTPWEIAAVQKQICEMLALPPFPIPNENYPGGSLTQLAERTIKVMSQVPAARS